MGLVRAEDRWRRRRPQWEIDYIELGQKYTDLVKKGESALRRGNRTKAEQYYANARAAWAERNAIMERHLREERGHERRSIEWDLRSLAAGRVEDYRIERLKRGIEKRVREARQYKEAIQAIGKEVPKSAYRVDTQKLVPGKQIEVMGMEHAIDEFLGTTYDSRLREITQQIGKKLKRGDSILLEMDPLFLAYCREKGRIFRLKNPAAYEPPRRFPRDIGQELKKTSERWVEGLKEIEGEREKYGLEPPHVSQRKKRLKERILGSGGFSTDSFGLGSASMSYFGVRLAEYLQRKGIEIIPMDSPYSHKAADKIRKAHIKLVRELKEEEQHWKNRDWDKIDKLKERVMESYIKYQTVILPFREKSWMRTLDRTMKGKNPPRMALVGMHHVPKMVRRINAAGYQAAYEWLPKIEPGVREAYRLDAERRKAKIARGIKKQKKKTQRKKAMRRRK